MESLNVSVAAGMLLYEALRQRWQCETRAADAAVQFGVCLAGRAVSLYASRAF